MFSLTKKVRWKKYFVLFLVSIENLKVLEYYTSLKEALFLSSTFSKCKNKNAKSRRNNWGIKYTWFIEKYIINLKICLKKT